MPSLARHPPFARIAPRQLGFGAPGRAASDAPVSAITQPTLILWGGRDRLIPPSVGERFHAAIAGSTFVLFDDLGHVPHEEAPAATLAPLRAFLDALADEEG